MTFYQARANRIQQLPQNQYRAVANTPVAQGQVAQTTQEGQGMTPAGALANAASLYGTGQTLAQMGKDVSGWFAPDVATDFAGLLQGSNTAATNAAFMGGAGGAGAAGAFPMGTAGGTGAASFMGGAGAAGSGAGYGTLLTGAEASPWITGATLGEGGMLGGATAASSAGTAAGAGAAEAGLLSSLGPVGLVAGLGLLGTKVAGLW